MHPNRTRQPLCAAALACLATALASCATPYARRGAAPLTPAATAAAHIPIELQPQEVVEDTGVERTGYVTLSGGITFQGVDTGGGVGSTTIDTTNLNGNVGFGFYLTKWLDIGASDNVFWTETKSGGIKTTTLANNINAFANFNILGFNDEIAAYVGPNIGLYLSETDSNNTSISSENISYGAQVGLRIFLSRRAAFKAELRSVFSEIDGVNNTSFDVDQTSILFGVDFTF